MAENNKFLSDPKTRSNSDGNLNNKLTLPKIKHSKSIDNIKSINYKSKYYNSNDSLKSILSVDSSSKSYDSLVDMCDKNVKYNNDNLHIKNNKIKSRIRSKSINYGSSPKLSGIIELIKGSSVSPSLGIELDYGYLDEF